ncbi:hypothetical protein ACFQX6_15275 [Streptosporangium lutulentum]
MESHVGIALPSDYKALAAYGPLDIGDFVWLYTPCVQEYEFNRLDAFDYVGWLEQTHRHCRIVARTVPPHTPPPFHPRKVGCSPGEVREAALTCSGTPPRPRTRTDGPS